MPTRPEVVSEEVICAADTGTVILRYISGGRLWLGLHAENAPEGEPVLGIVLTARQQRGIQEALEIWGGFMGQETEDA